MLILSRRQNESLHIGDDVVVTVLGIKGKLVRLGISAPKTVVVDREEVHARKLREAAAAPTQRPDRLSP
jgi:carbon storage regulator